MINNLIINLAQPSKSDIAIEVITFNDGEPHLFIREDLNRKKEYTICTRISNPNDLYIFLQCCDILNRHGVVYDVAISYLMGMRMDRVINWTEAFSLDVVCTMIKSVCKSPIITVLEAHSDRTSTLLNSWGTDYFFNKELEDMSYDAFVYPDAGAKERYASFDYSEDKVAYGVKVRNLQTGQIESYKLENADILKDCNNICVLDDLCDGGRTFMELAKLLDEACPDANRDLYIVHAVNEQGINTVASAYDNVIITNSYADWTNLRENIRVEDVFSNDEWMPFSY